MTTIVFNSFPDVYFGYDEEGWYNQTKRAKIFPLQLVRSFWKLELGSNTSYCFRNYLADHIGVLRSSFPRPISRGRESSEVHQLHSLFYKSIVWQITLKSCATHSQSHIWNIKGVLKNPNTLQLIPKAIFRAGMRSIETFEGRDQFWGLCPHVTINIVIAYRRIARSYREYRLIKNISLFLHPARDHGKQWQITPINPAQESHVSEPWSPTLGGYAATEEEVSLDCSVCSQ